MGMLNARCLVVVLLIMTGVIFGQEQPPKAEVPQEVDLIWGVKVPMRDGVKLNATVYRPHDQKERLPVVFTFTPYISDSYHARAWYFAQHGYVFALVDVRGRGNSGGNFEPFANEGRDGHDVVEGLAQQPWSNGSVTMWGGSYAGFDQWSTLKELPPHLKTIVPVASAYAAADFPFFKNVAFPYEIQWLTYTSGVTGQGNLFGESAFWIQKFRERYMTNAPFRDLDKIVGNTSTVWQKWMAHPEPDAYWSAMAPTREQYARMNVPILSITGMYDGDQTGAMTYYREHMQYGSADAKARHYLIIGPWDHPGTRTPKAEVGGLKFGAASLLDMNKLHKDWYDWTLKSGTKPEFLKQRVAYYVTGKDEWKYADTLEAISNRTSTLYLGSAGKANSVFESGTLGANATAADAAKQDQWTYDPLDTRPAEMEKEDIANPITDQRYALNLYGNGVVYHSVPLEQDTEISGYLKATLWLAMDVPDTDISVSVYEIQLDGTSIALTSDLIRARYRESLTEAKLVKTGEINKYEFNTFQWMSRLVKKGSRLRLVIGCPNSIYVQKNYNSGGVVADESGKDARTAHITLYHDAQHPSALVLPVVDAK
ncbi:MAG: CocE/NonD family hydrolase [Acidobacteriota bacterium]|nr:CocE/NonD family hydrolase [Acidobacteriota bacterium]